MARMLSVAATHSGASFAVGYLMTGSLLIGSVVAVAEPLCDAIVRRACDPARRRGARRRADLVRLPRAGRL